MRKFAVPFVQKQQRAIGPNDDQVLTAVVVEVGKQRAGSIFENAESRRFRDVLEGAVAAIAIETVRQAGGLADVEIVETVAVDVADRNAIVAVDIDARKHWSSTVRQ